MSAAQTSVRKNKSVFVKLRTFSKLSFLIGAQASPLAFQRRFGAKKNARLRFKLKANETLVRAFALMASEMLALQSVTFLVQILKNEKILKLIIASAQVKRLSICALLLVGVSWCAEAYAQTNQPPRANQPETNQPPANQPGETPQKNQTQAEEKSVAEEPRVAEEVTVTASRTETRTSETPASVVVLSAEDLQTSAAIGVDERLRQVAGFQLFRRAGTRTANPTTQGASLRGIGASGASRASVLYDGVPLNDAFGGWIYWGRVARAGVERIEVLRGGASDLYGGAALSGVVAIEPKRVRRDDSFVYQFEGSIGNQTTPEASLFTGVSFGKWQASFDGEAFKTDGFILVDKLERGQVDTPAGVNRAGGNLTLERDEIRLPFGGGNYTGRSFVRASYYAEGRANGTALQTNATRLRGVTFGLDFNLPVVGQTRARLYGNTQNYRQSFSAIDANRASESLTRTQRVPSEAIGLSLQSARPLGSRTTVVAGVDARRVRGRSDEIIFVGQRPTTDVSAGGSERTNGVFATAIVRANQQVIFNLGARYDAWRNYDARSSSVSILNPNVRTATDFSVRRETAFSPRASVLYKATTRISLIASASRAFRQPTLNELYRTFRIGNIVTQANEDLRAERLSSGEAGASFASNNNRFNARGVTFISDVARPVANVTLNVAPNLITRRRQNLGRTRARGFEFDADTRLTSNVTISGSYLFADARVREFPANRALEDLRLPQVPRHQATLQARYVNPRFLTLAIQARAATRQFDDDLNQFSLNRFLTADLFAARRVRRNMDLFIGVENFTNSKIETARTPLVTYAVNSPLVRIGVRLMSSFK